MMTSISTKKRIEKLKYMHRNPVKRGLCAAPEEWKWSSYRTYRFEECRTSGNDSQNGNWAYTYDPFNRLKTASKTGQAFQWDYDRYGNRWHQTVTQGSGGQSSLSFSANNNQVDGETYDAAGNVTHVGTRAYTYDAENRVTSVAGDTTASYVYDAEGRRIKTQVFEYLYNLDGRPIALLNASTGANIYDEIYAGGRHLATYSGSVTNFDHTDWLGTERVRTGPTGTVSETCTSLPFGDGQTCTGTEWSYLHFTGDEHDYETGLDHTLFRQFQSLEGRWLSVDPLAGDIGDPQSLNRYAYVENDPVNFSDPFGLASLGPLTSIGTDGCLYEVTYNPETKAVIRIDVISCPSGGSGGAGGNGGGKSGTSPSPNNGRNCTPNSASAGQYAISTAAVAGMTAEFFSGVGAQDRTFGPDSSVSQVMAQSAGVQDALNEYYILGRTSNLYTFGGAGYASAGANPVAQFVGSFRWSITPGNGGINLRLTNTSSFKSLTYDKGPQWQRHTAYPGAGIPMGNTHQVYNIFVPCKVG